MSLGITSSRAVIRLHLVGCSPREPGAHWRRTARAPPHKTLRMETARAVRVHAAALWCVVYLSWFVLCPLWDSGIVCHRVQACATSVPMCVLASPRDIAMGYGRVRLLESGDGPQRANCGEKQFRSRVRERETRKSGERETERQSQTGSEGLLIQHTNIGGRRAAGESRFLVSLGLCISVFVSLCLRGTFDSIFRLIQSEHGGRAGLHRQSRARGV